MVRDSAGVGRTHRLTQGDGLGAGRFEGLLPDRTLVTASLVSFVPDEEYYVRAGVRAILRRPFRRSVHSVAWQGLIVTSPSDEYEIRAYEPNGVLRVIVRRDHSRLEVTQAEVDAYVARRLATADPEVRPTMERVMAGLPPVESLPAFSASMVDVTGDLWVREYTRPGDERSVWTIFASDGRVRGLVETPAGLTVHQIGSDFLLGTDIDELGVERVQLWGLDRSMD